MNPEAEKAALCRHTGPWPWSARYLLCHLTGSPPIAPSTLGSFFPPSPCTWPRAILPRHAAYLPLLQAFPLQLALQQVREGLCSYALLTCQHANPLVAPSSPGMPTQLLPHSNTLPPVSFIRPHSTTKTCPSHQPC